MFGNNKKQQSDAPSGRIFVFLLILVAVVILAVVVIYYGFKQEYSGNSGDSAQSVIDSLSLNASGTMPLAASTTVTDPIRRLAEKTGRPALGNPAAGLVIVEFADFECPVCYEEFYQIREFVNRHRSEVYYIYRHYPVNGNNSVYLAKASMCAYEQDKFWPLHDKLFLNQGQIESAAAVSDLVRQSGLAVSQFEQCMRDDKYRGLVFEDMNDAVNLGAQGTPTFFINGSKLEGVVKLVDWESILAKYKEISSNN